MSKFILIGDTYVPVGEILYFKDQIQGILDLKQTFIKLKDGNFLIIDGHHAKTIINAIEPYQVTYESR